MSVDVGVIGVGNPLRGDDSAGLDLIGRLAEQAPNAPLYRSDGEVSGLIDCFRRHGTVVIVDAARGGMPSGSVVRIDALKDSLGLESVRSSTHALGLAEAVELARTLDTLPERLEVFAIVGECFELGTGLTAPVAAAVDEVAGRIASEFLT